MEAELAGEEVAVAALLDRLRVGPPAARVDALDSADMAAGSWTSFEVRR